MDSKNFFEFEKVTLEWIKLNSNKEIPNVSGLYQIYGDSPVYGMNTLLYIGKAESLYRRIIKGHSQNLESFITRQPNINYRFAELPKNLKEVESILIAMHKPSFNSTNIIEICQEAMDKLYYIQNHGERGMLHLECTNFYFYKPITETNILTIVNKKNDIE